MTLARLLLLIACSATTLFVTPAPTHAQNGDDPSRPYCGLHCLYGAAVALGVELEYEPLISEKYIGCSLGSSLEELRLAAEDHGLDAWPLGGMTQDFLARSSYPVILHVKQSASANVATHYVLFLGWTEGGAKIVDPGKPARVTSPTELAGVWRGDGLLVAPKGTSDFAAIIKPSILTFLSIPIAGLAAAFLYGVQKVRRKPEASRAGVGPQALSTFTLVALAIACGIVWQLCSPAGLFANGVSLQALGNSLAEGTFPSLTRAGVEQMIQDGNALLVDARMPSDFAHGHIEAAINVPPHANAEERHQALGAIPRDATLIVYCSGPKCPFAEITAGALRADGYEKIYLFRGGLEEWPLKH